MILGEIQPLCYGLNYRELSILSPIKLMTQITRKGTLGKAARIGHYEVNGTMFTTHNFEYAEMAYGGSLGLFFQKGEIAGINKQRISLAYAALQQTHPLLARYNLQKLTCNLVNYHINHNREYIGVSEGFRNSMLLPLEDTHAEAVGHDVQDLIIGSEVDKKVSVRYGEPALLALLFPHLYTNCTGHYSMTHKNERPELQENQGGVSEATLAGMTLGDYSKSRLLMRDRRFAKDPSFLFFVLDAIEKHNIASAERRQVSTKNKGMLRQGDVVNTNSDGTKSFKKSESSFVPPSIRTSYSYQRKKHLDVKTIFQNLGEPQIFMTFTCDDTEETMKRATGLNAPWEDPVLFALHFKRKWTTFFSKYVLAKWGFKIGGIKDFCWVVEIQDRGINI